MCRLTLWWKSPEPILGRSTYFPSSTEYLRYLGWTLFAGILLLWDTWSFPRHSTSSQYNKSSRIHLCLWSNSCSNGTRKAIILDPSFKRYVIMLIHTTKTRWKVNRAYFKRYRFIFTKRLSSLMPLRPWQTLVANFLSQSCWSFAEQTLPLHLGHDSMAYRFQVAVSWSPSLQLLQQPTWSRYDLLLWGYLLRTSSFFNTNIAEFMF